MPQAVQPPHDPVADLLNANGQTIEQSPIKESDLAELLMLVQQDVISGKIAKTVFEEMAAGGKSPKQIVEEKGLAQVSDSGAIDTEIDRVLADHPDEAARYKAGEAKLLGFFVGRIMKATRGKANPKLVNQRLKSKLDR